MRPGGCTRRARATIRWRPTSGLWVRDCHRCHRRWRLRSCNMALARKAEAHAATVMPGFTHLQPAQPVTFGHHLLAYVEMLGARPRPVRRCAQAAQRVPARARRRWPARRSRSIATGPPKRSASTGRWPTRSTASRTAISRSRRWRRRRSARRAFVAAGRGDRDLDDAAVRLRQAFRQVHHRLLDHAAEAQPGRGGAERGPRSGASPALSRASSSS